MKAREIDFVERLNFFLEAIHQDAKQSNNIIIFDYDPAYPRYFDLSPSNIIKTMEYLAKIFIFSQENAQILIRFKLANYNISSLHFELIVRSNKPLEHIDTTLLQRAHETASKADGFITTGKKDELKFSFKAPLASSTNTIKSLDLGNDPLSRYNVAIAYENVTGFNILAKQLRFAGISVRPSRDVQSLLRHLNDAIYRPDIIFVQKELLDDEETRGKILDIVKVRHCVVCAICEHDEKSDFITLNQPYTYDTLRVVLDMCYAQNSQNRERERESEALK